MRVVLRFLRETRSLLDQIVLLSPDVVVGNLRSGGPYVQAIEPVLRQRGIEVVYHRVCSAWGHQLKTTAVALPRLHWLFRYFTRGARIVLVDVSRRVLSDAQRVVMPCAVFLYNEVLATMRGEAPPNPPPLTLNRTAIAYLANLPEWRDAHASVRMFLGSCGAPVQSLPYALYLTFPATGSGRWLDGFSCILPINASRDAWMDDRSATFAWLPTVARLCLGAHVRST